MLSTKQDVTHLVDLVTIECANLPPLHISHQLLLGVPETIITRSRHALSTRYSFHYHG